VAGTSMDNPPQSAEIRIERGRLNVPFLPEEAPERLWETGLASKKLKKKLGKNSSLGRIFTSVGAP